MTVQFRVFFSHMPPETVEAESGDKARDKAAKIAKDNNTFVTKVKRVKGRA